MHAGAHTQRASRLCVCVCVRVRHSMRAPRHACVQARLHAHTRTRMQARARTQPNTRLLAHFRLVCQGVAIHDPRVAGDFDCDRSFLVRGRERAVAQVPFEVCLHRDCTDGAESEYQLGRCRQTPAGLRAACARTRGKIPGLAKSAAAAPNPTTAWLILTDRPPSPSPERICSFPAPLRSTGRARLGGAAATARASPKPSWRKGTSSLVIATARARARAFARGLAHDSPARSHTVSRRPWKASAHASSAPADASSTLALVCMVVASAAGSSREISEEIRVIMAARGRGAWRVAVFLHLVAAAARGGARPGPSADELLVFGLGSSDQKVGVRAGTLSAVRAGQRAAVGRMGGPAYGPRAAPTLGRPPCGPVLMAHGPARRRSRPPGLWQPGRRLSAPRCRAGCGS